MVSQLQKLPAVETVGALEPIAYFNDAMLTGVTVSHQGRIFVNFPKWGDEVEFTVAEIREGKAVAYSSQTFNQTQPDDLAAALVSVQSVVVDPVDRLWILDTGSPLFQPTQYGGPKLTHWITSAPLGATIEWDATITEDRENELIAWASVEGADVDNSGFIRFQPVPKDSGTEVEVVTQYNPPAGAIGAALTKFTEGIARLFGEEPKQQIGDDLRHFKMLMETGEIATTEGQPNGHS